MRVFEQVLGNVTTTKDELNKSVREKTITHRLESEAQGIVEICRKINNITLP